MTQTQKMAGSSFVTTGYYSRQLPIERTRYSFIVQANFHITSLKGIQSIITHYNFLATIYSSKRNNSQNIIIDTSNPNSLRIPGT